MQYVIAFLEGTITFISPCLLPMLPIYISYFAGGGERTTSKTLNGALGFVTGFTVVFVMLGALAGLGYYYVVGCSTGSCAITSNPIITMIYMGVIGLLLSGLFGKGCDG